MFRYLCVCTADDDEEVEEEEEEEEEDGSDDDGTMESDSDLEGRVASRTVAKLAKERALKAALKSGCYPEYEGFEGPYQATDPASNNPLDYLKLLWPESLFDRLVVETNRYAHSRSRGRHWVDVNKDEIETFMGIVILMGVHRLPRIADVWDRDELLGIGGVQKYMSSTRFWDIWVNLHVVDNKDLLPGDGIARKIKPVLDVLGETFCQQYSPAQELSVDEAMCKYKGRVRGKVHMPKKPIKYGFKIWCCCCSCCGYLCTFQVYGGVPRHPVSGEKMPEKGMVMRVVKDLVAPFSDLNHVLYMDNFFTSGPLVEALAKQSIYVAGTIKQNASGFPDGLKGIKPALGTYVVETVAKITYFAFMDRKLVSFVTNAFPESMPAVPRKEVKGKVITYQNIPPVSPAYDKFMGGVDSFSQRRERYGYDRKSKRYWLRLFFQFFDYAINNALHLV